MSLMPCFAPDQAFAEGVILGRLLAGYGELELTMCACLMAVDGAIDAPIRNIFRPRGAETRIKTAKTYLLTEYAKANLLVELTEALDGMEWCRQVRNQYAHCHWYYTKHEGLCFINLEELAHQPTAIVELMANKHPIDVALLLAQEAFFKYVKESFVHLETEYKSWKARQSTPQLRPYTFPKPTAILQPSKHN